MDARPDFSIHPWRVHPRIVGPCDHSNSCSSYPGPASLNLAKPLQKWFQNTVFYRNQRRIPLAGEEEIEEISTHSILCLREHIHSIYIHQPCDFANGLPLFKHFIYRRLSRRYKNPHWLCCSEKLKPSRMPNTPRSWMYLASVTCAFVWTNRKNRPLQRPLRPCKI